MLRGVRVVKVMRIDDCSTTRQVFLGTLKLINQIGIQSALGLIKFHCKYLHTAMIELTNRQTNATNTLRTTSNLEQI